MVKPRKSWWCLAIVSFTLGGSTYSTIHDSLIQAQNAFLQGDYASALRYYEQAARTTEDPGLVAFNQGTVHAAAEQYGPAALAFGRSLEDARGLRRVKATFGQGTALTMMGAQLTGTRAVAVLREALQSFAIALRETSSLSPEESRAAERWREDIKLNQAVAERLLQQKLREPEPTPPAPYSSEPDLLEQLQSQRASAGNGTADKEDRPLPEHDSSAAQSTGPETTSTGRGSLPPLLDEPNLPPLDPQEAERRLRDALRRLQQPLSNISIKPGAKDW